jgi:catechol 2,3-dioxygenase-like lactoylglutathione lyase family enzyme
MQTATSDIYKQNAFNYRERGWACVLPLPPGQKFPPPNGRSGYDGVEPDDAQIEQWRAEKPDGNIALVMPDTVVGIDVDAHDGKRGEETFKAAQARFGPLPATWTSTARGVASPSRHYFFRVPAGAKLESTLEVDGQSNVEIIQRYRRKLWMSPWHENAAYLPP